MQRPNTHEIFSSTRKDKETAEIGRGNEQHTKPTAPNNKDVIQALVANNPASVTGEN